MICSFRTGPVGKETFLRSVAISQVGGCNSPVEQSGEYNPNWSYLIVTSLTFQGHLLPAQR